MGVLDKFLGSKSGRDIKAIEPVVKKIKDAENQVSGLSNDQLRDKTQEFRQRISEHISAEGEEVKDLKATIEAEEDIMEREKMWEQVDKLEKSFRRVMDQLEIQHQNLFQMMKE